MFFAGTPPLMEYGGVDLFTTPPTAITEPLPIVTPLSIVTFVPHFFICDLYYFDINLSLKYSQPLKKIFKIIVYLYKYLIEALFC